MSAATIFSTTRTSAQPKPKQTHPYASYLIFIFCSILYLLPFLRIMLAPQTDEGILIAGAVRAAHGQLFARDFFEIMGPGTFYWLGVFFKLFGVTFLATRICLFVTSLGTGVLVYFLSRRICTSFRLLPCLLIVSTYFGLLWPTISHHVDSNFFALLSFACVLIWHERRSAILLPLAGALAAATTCILQPKGILLFFAILAWLAIQLWRRQSPFSALCMVIAGYAGMVGSVVLYYWSKGALWDLAFATFIHNLRYYGPMNVVPYASGIIQTYWSPLAHSGANIFWTIPLASILVVPFLFIAALPGILLVLAVIKRCSFLQPTILLYWFCGSALWLSEFHRRDISHLVMGSPLLVILCVHFLGEGNGKLKRRGLQLLATCAALLAGFNLLLVLFAHPTPTRVGTVAMFGTDPVLTYLNEHVAPGSELFVYPFYPMYYFLTETNNPTRYTGLGYNYNTTEQFMDAIQTLERRRVRFVLWDTGLFDRVLPKAFPSLPRMPKNQYLMEPYLESHYKVVWKNNDTVLMERIGESGAR
jgi:4-amino-4-deoxy-L-arabinose transferase-like glycosyltransferase